MIVAETSMKFADSGSMDISSSRNVDNEMTSNSGIYTISKRELEGHDNLGHSISQITIVEDKLAATGSSTIETTSTNTMPLKPKLCLASKIGISFDILITIITLAFIIVAEIGIIPHFKQGFFCQDDMISHKYSGDTIPMGWVVISAFFPIGIMYIVESFRCDVEMPEAIKSKKTIHQILLWSRDYLLGIVVKLFIVETLKVVTGELRPHFLDTCKPDAALNCTKGEFITEYTCTNHKVGFYLMSDSSRSFPSGHASLGLYEGVFLAWYFHFRFPKCGSIFLRPLFQCISLTWAVVCGITRIGDHRHHWWDVLIGDIIGFFFVVLVCMLLCKNFHVKSPQPHNNQNGHLSVKRLLSNSSCKEDCHIAMDQA